jgi:hypothetical protein
VDPTLLGIGEEGAFAMLRILLFAVLMLIGSLPLAQNPSSSEGDEQRIIALENI